MPRGRFSLLTALRAARTLKEMTRAVRHTFDTAKDAANRAKHGVSLALGAEVVGGAVTTFLDTRCDYGEDRFVTFGLVGSRLYCAVWTLRDDEMRIISVRKANAKEQKRYG